MTLTQFHLLAYVWILIALIMLPILLKVKQPYGRHTSKGFGPMINNKIAWAMMELPSPITFSLCFFYSGLQHEAPVWIIYGCYMLHYVNRSIIYPLRLKTPGKQMPLLIALSAVFFNLMNGFVNGYYLGKWGLMGSYAYIGIIPGILLFFIGFYINNKADQILLNLRAPGETGYKIPKGFLYNLISCPNYFGEIMEWGGFAIMGGNVAALSFFVWAVVNLVPRALNHHQWYKEKFPDYPKERKAVIPYIL
jgi:3-oxo-5-alpha-steroid 4-dehydrogenase 1